MIKFTDWQISNLEKTVESIQDSMRKQNRTIATTLLMVFFNITAVLVACDWSEKKIYNTIIISICGIILCVYFVYVYLIPLCSNREKAKRRIISPDTYVDIFDNSVCQYVMQAKSFQKEAEQATGLEREFYYSQVSYYIRKTIIKLDLIGKYKNDLFTDDVMDPLITYRRLILVCRLIVECKESLADQIDANKTHGTLADENNHYYNRLDAFINSFDDSHPIADAIYSNNE